MAATQTHSSPIREANAILRNLMYYSKNGLPLCPTILDLGAGRGERLQVFGYNCGSYPDMILGYGATPQAEDWLPGRRVYERQARPSLREFIGTENPWLKNGGLDIALGIDTDLVLPDFSDKEIGAVLDTLTAWKPALVLWSCQRHTPDQWKKAFIERKMECWDIFRPDLWYDDQCSVLTTENLILAGDKDRVKAWLDVEKHYSFGFYDVLNPRRE